MTFELFTNATVSSTSYPSSDDINVRFYFANGSAAENPVTVYPLFGLNQDTLSWPTFVSEMNKFAISEQADWCTACGNTTGTCASTTTSSSSSGSTSATSSKSSSGGVSRVVAGVIGAMVTLAVILGLEALVLLVGGLRIAKKHTRGVGHAVSGETAGPMKSA